ncbi:hypothetical protein ANOM_009840 [Aspergillus nomiae NRRL 13137]|uniref:ferric-chelate reductase (NADPH) n=1 Tax=Aspergillus nomiae NRRL (strain ATCC 15546 / NRRL 13137 / CBS 260.88 / M93) TaxID=1509407 RepID=A0A0L1IZ83_ASPN3|nr:uncharacterized protein ANOM_009840 [Aspergillus nomiae NRRL 13137]KNG84829.1 hypothetical protein ANOM_009840 [Aspergillus nomiae NRRL 13137]
MFRIPSLQRLVLTTAYLVGTGVCNFVGVQSLPEAGSRAARLSLINLMSLFFSGGNEFGARLLGVSLGTYGAFHRTVGFVTVIQATIHVVIIAKTRSISASDNLQFYGILHTHIMQSTDAWVYLRGCAIVFIVSFGAQLIRILFRNLVIGRKCTKLTLHTYGENIARLTLTLPRPWGVRAGERVVLSIPSIGLFYLVQSHPFAICWWEDDGTKKAVSVSLLFRPRSGFTRKILDRLEQDREYTVWIDGPFGPASISSYGLCGHMGNYGHVFMVATGIGIAAQLPYIKELLKQYRQARIRTQRISLVWQLEQEGDWESVHDWLQVLVKEDEGYLLSVTIYDALNPSLKGGLQRFGYHDLIEVHGGEPNWEQQMSTEMEKQKGNMLVAGSLDQSPIKSIQR